MEFVLPIKSFEKDTYVSPYSILMTRSEKSSFFNDFAMFIYEVSIAYILISVLTLHVAQAADLEQQHHLVAMFELINEGSVELLKKSSLDFRLGYKNYFFAIYSTMFFLVAHSVYTKRFRTVVCGAIYEQIEESRAMALYHTILVQRQDLFDIRYALLQDRLADEEAPETKNGFYFRFNWWRRLSGAYKSIKDALQTGIVDQIYEYCALCGDYGNGDLMEIAQSFGSSINSSAVSDFLFFQSTGAQNVGDTTNVQWRTVGWCTVRIVWPIWERRAFERDMESSRQRRPI